MEKVVDRFILGEQKLNRDLLGTAGHSQGALLCCRMTELSFVAKQLRSWWHSVVKIQVEQWHSCTDPGGTAAKIQVAQW